MTTVRHWTERSIEDFAYSVAADFIDLLAEEMDRLGWSKAKLAKAAKVSKGRITQIFKNPSNLEIITMAKIARALKMKMAAFPYRDLSDPGNERGPINSEVFRLCWENAKRPADLWELRSAEMARQQSTSYVAVPLGPKGRAIFWVGPTITDSPAGVDASQLEALIRAEKSPAEPKATKGTVRVNRDGTVMRLFQR